MSSKLLTVTETAERLGTTRATIYKMRARDPSFPAMIYLSNRMPRFCVDEVDAWIETKRADAA